MDNQQDTNNTENKVSPGNLHSNLYEQYRHEIDALWRNSNYAWVFEGLLFAAYGFVLSKIIESDYKVPFNYLAVLITFLGLCMSAIWIALAKASKTWQEWYEERIIAFEEDFDLFPYQSDLIMGSSRNKIKGIDTALHTANCGKFSPSKINIFISHSIWCLWLIIGIFHIIICLNYKFILAVYFGLYLLYIIMLKLRCPNDYIEPEDFKGDYILMVYNKLELLSNEAHKISTSLDLYNYFINKFGAYEWKVYDGLKNDIFHREYSQWGQNPYSKLLDKFKREYIVGRISETDVASYINEINDCIEQCKESLGRTYVHDI